MPFKILFAPVAVILVYAIKTDDLALGILAVCLMGTCVIGSMTRLPDR